MVVAEGGNSNLLKWLRHDLTKNILGQLDLYHMKPMLQRHL